MSQKSMNTRRRHPSDKKYYPSIQILRGLAALSVVFFHVSEMLLQYTEGDGLFCRLSSLWSTGAAGVDLFFVISGFVMVQSSRGMFGQKGASEAFIRRRLVRIVPLYWFYTSIMLVLVLLPFTLRGQVFSWEFTLKSFFFIPAFNPSNGLDLPLLPPGWTLSYEMYFYVIFSLLLCFHRRFLLPATTVLFLVSVVIGLWQQVQDPVLKVMTSPLLLEFILGCFLAGLVNHRELSRSSCLVLIGGSLLALFWVCGIKIDNQTRFIFWGMPVFFLMTGIVFLEKRVTLGSLRLLTLLGDSSYSIYLSHIFIVLCVSTLLKRKIYLHSLSNDLVAGCTIIGCILLGYLSYKYIEQNTSRALVPRFCRKEEEVRIGAGRSY
jgi:peptidoglycan/LPS O-acetylase OafA/YrhL